MTSSFRESNQSADHRLLTVGHWLRFLIPLLFLATMARRPIVGDPTEYTFVAHVLGVAHPPGYAFMTVVGKLYQTLIPFGGIAWRTHLIGVTAGTIAAFCVFGIIRSVINLANNERPPTKHQFFIPLFAALSVAAGANFWQHSIHANPHIVTAMFLVINLYTLTKWFEAHATATSKRDDRRWLYAFCFSAGLGVTHHPLTAFALPACALFVIVVDARILLDWKTLLKGTGFVLTGLLVWLYFPLRAPALAGNTQFVHDMNTLDGFLNLVLARGLRVNLFAFGLSDQWDRLTVFWTLMRVQYVWLAILCLPFGLLALISSKQIRPLLILFGGAFLLNYIFVMNTVQDVMAYLLGPYIVVGVFIGIGLYKLTQLIDQSTQLRPKFGAILITLILITPLFQVATNLWRGISLSDYSEGTDYIAAIHEQFDASDSGGVLLNDWEHMTPIWYERLVNERWFDENDIRPIFVSSAKPWLDHVFENLPAGPVFLNRFERSVFDAGFRLRARGVDEAAQFWQVVEPGDTSIPHELIPINFQAGEIKVVAVGAGGIQSDAGAPDHLGSVTLAMRTPSGTDDFYVPFLLFGNGTRFEFTTDSHLISPEWLPSEIIVERFEFGVPHRDSGPQTVKLGIKNLITGEEYIYEESPSLLTLAGINNADEHDPQMLVNFRKRVGLNRAWTRNGLFDRRRNVWDNPLTAKSSDTIHLTLEWQVLRKPEDSYTVFVHLIDLANRPIIDSLDYTPLGGATPSHLWFPKWLPGQRMLDPYQMPLEGVPPGEYLIEVGLYEQFTKRRLHIHDENGNLNGDRFILGKVIVEE